MGGGQRFEAHTMSSSDRNLSSQGRRPPSGRLCCASISSCSCRCCRVREGQCQLDGETPSLISKKCASCFTFVGMRIEQGHISFFRLDDCATSFISTHLMAMSPISDRKAPTAIPDIDELAWSAERQLPRPPPAPAEVAFPSSQTHPVCPKHASGLPSTGHPAKHVVPGIPPPHPPRPL
jgi:hypothetical protein